uniref:Uncharacterized protein n=1 Tax=Sphaerodactylus townsendi TaxID=933632 RepID=A0ACB8G4C0_9SAUR
MCDYFFHVTSPIYVCASGSHSVGESLFRERTLCVRVCEKEGSFLYESRLPHFLPADSLPFHIQTISSPELMSIVFLSVMMSSFLLSLLICIFAGTLQPYPTLLVLGKPSLLFTSLPFSNKNLFTKNNSPLLCPVSVAGALKAMS